jgi:dCTP deaminase
MINFFAPTQGILSDRDIIKTFAEPTSPGKITPFFPYLIKEGLSYGLSSFGYDFRLSPHDFYVMPFTEGYVIDPKSLTKEQLNHQQATIDESGVYFIIPPNSYALGCFVEYIEMPDDVIGICWGKSTNARSGLIINVTPIEPGWHGWITVEITNSSPNPCKVYCEGIAQYTFFRGKEPQVKYESRKYQDQQSEVTLPRVTP